MTEDQMRAEFEAAYADAAAESAKYTMTDAERAAAINGIKKDRTPTGYAFGRYDVAWRLWQASRKAVCVSLPKPFGSSTMCNDFLIYGEVTKALDKAGVAYK